MTTTTTTMRSAVTVEWGRVRVLEREVPRPGPGQARLRVRLAGICGSDVHIFEGHHPTAVPGVVQGHEFVATLEALGPDTDCPLAPGARVVVEPLISCGVCEACRRGHRHVCRRLNLLGIHVDGAFAPAVLVDAAKLIAVPDGLPDRVAVLAEPVAVAVHVVRRAGLGCGERALVVGGGAIGLLVAMTAAESGAAVTISEPDPGRRARAGEQGFATIDPADDPESRVAELTAGDGYDAVFEVSGSEPGLGFALRAARVRARVVQVGFFARPPALDGFALTLKELSLLGSRVYTGEDFRRTPAVLARLAARFDLAALLGDTVGLDGVGNALERMIAGDAAGKILVDPTT